MPTTPTAPYSSADVTEDYFDGGSHITRCGGKDPTLALLMRDVFSRIIDVGEFATNALAYAAADALGFVTSGTPDTGVSYWNTTYGCSRTFDGTIWRGFSDVGPVLAADKTIYVDGAAGSDITGDGLTASTAYASQAAAAQDVPSSMNGTAFDYVVQLVGAGPYVFDAQEFAHVRARYLDYFSHCIIQGETSNASTFPESVDGLVTIQGGGITQDSLAEGRAYVINTGVTPMVAHAHIGQPCTIASCGAAVGNVGRYGIVVDNTVDTVYVLFAYGTTYGDMAAGDTIQMYDYDTTIEAPASGYSMGDLGGFHLKNLVLDGIDIRNTGGRFYLENVNQINDAAVVTNYDSVTTYKNCAWINPAGGGTMGGPASARGGVVEFDKNGYNLLSAWDGAAQEIGVGGHGNTWRMRGEIVFANMIKLTFSTSDLQFGVWNSATSPHILLHAVTTSFLSFAAAASCLKPMSIIMPLINAPTAFPLAGYLVDVGAYPLVTEKGFAPGSQIAFQVTPVVVTAGATTNLCRINAVAGQYFYHDADGREVLSIRGTGNTPKRIAITGNHTVIVGDGVESIDCSPPGGHIALVLPAVNTELGRRITLNRLTAAGNNVNITGTINGNVNPTVIAAQWDSITIEQTATEWRQVGATP